MLTSTKKNTKSIKLGEKITCERAKVKVCINERYFKSLAATKLSFNREYLNTDVTIVNRVCMLSVLNQVKLMFDVKKIEKYEDHTIIEGDNYTVIIKKNYSEFKEELIFNN